MKKIIYLLTPSFLFMFMTFHVHSQDLVNVATFGSYYAEFIHGYSIDHNGDVVYCGTFQNTIDLNFDESEEDELTAHSKYDIYVAKCDIKGNHKWAFNIGGDPNGHHYVKDIATDNSGNVFITGFSGHWIDFDPSAEKDSIKPVANKMFYFAKYNSNGEHLWAHGFSNNQKNGNLIGWCIEVDKTDGSVYVAGNINDSIDFDPSEGEHYVKPPRYSDFFLAKYTNEGELVWVNTLSYTGELGYGNPTQLVIDENKNIYLSGSYAGYFDLDPSENVSNIVSNGQTDGFIVKYNSAGEYLWKISYGGTDQDYIRSMRMLNGSLYAVGDFSDTVDFDPSENTYEMHSIPWETSGYVAKYDLDGNFIRAFGLENKMIEVNGSGSSTHDIDMDIHGSLYTIGSFYGTVDFDPSDDSVKITSTGGITDYDMFLAKYDDETNLDWVINVGGYSPERGYYTCVTDSGDVIAMGYYDGDCDFDPTENEAWEGHLGSHDVYFAWYYAYTPENSGQTNTQFPTHLLRAYPNPASQVLRLQGMKNISEISIYNHVGVLVKKQVQTDLNGEIDISDLPVGCYLLSANGDNASYTVRFVKIE